MADSDGKILASEFIDSGIKTELKAVVDEMQRLVKVTSDLMGVIRQSTNDQKGYVTVQKEVEKVSKDIVAVESKMKVLDTDLAKEAERKRQVYQKAAKEQKDNIAAETSAYKRLSVEYGKALQKAKDLAAQYGVQSEQAKGAIATAKGLNDQLKAIDASMGNNQRKVGGYAEALETTNMSLGEMKRTLRELRNIPLAGKTPEEIAQVEKQIAMLTDEMGDYQARMRSSGDSVQVMIEGLQGIVAVAQGVTGALSAMGFDTEKLDKAMVQLIGVSQALATVHELNEKQTLKTVAALIKDTYAKVANAIATKAQTMATEGATVATRVFGNALKSVPLIAIIAAVAAVASALVILAVKMRQANAETRMMNKVNAEAAKSTADERANLDILVGIAKDHSRSITERRKAIEAINKISPEYLGNITLENIETDKSVVAIENYINALDRKARSQAYNNLLTEKYTELAEEEAKTFDELSVAEQAYYMSLATLNLGSGLSGRELYNLEQGKRIGDIYKEINALKKLAYQYVEVDDIVQGTGSTGGGTTPNQNKFEPIGDAEDIGRYFSEITAQTDRGMQILNDAMNKKLKEGDDERMAEQDKLYEYQIQKEKIHSELFIKTEEQLYEDSLKKLKYYLAMKLINQEEYTKLVDDLNKKTAEKESAGYVEAAMFFNEQIGNIVESSITRQGSLIDTMKEKTDLYYDNLLKKYSDDENAQRQLLDAKAKEDEKYDKQKKALQIRQMKFERAQALFSISLSTSVAIMRILADESQQISKPVLIAQAIAQAAAQTAAALSTPIPAYASGIESTPKTGAALVGERGSEAILYPDGSVAIADKPTVAILPKGTEVKNAFDTEDYLRKLSFAAMLPRIGKTDANEKDYTAMLKDIHRTLKRGNTVINQGMSAREQYYYKKYSV